MGIDLEEFRRVINSPEFERVFKNCFTAPVVKLETLSNSSARISVKEPSNYQMSADMLSALNNVANIKTVRKFWENIESLFGTNIELVEPLTRSGRGTTAMFVMKIRSQKSTIKLSFAVRKYSRDYELSLYKGGGFAGTLTVTDKDHLLKEMKKIIGIHSVHQGKDTVYFSKEFNKNVVSGGCLVVSGWRQSGFDEAVKTAFTKEKAFLYLNSVYDRYNPSATNNPRKLIGSILGKKFNTLSKMPGRRFFLTDEVGGETIFILE
jgi:hypothetical protein